jgi:hypothetical protein
MDMEHIAIRDIEDEIFPIAANEVTTLLLEDEFTYMTEDRE